MTTSIEEHKRRFGQAHDTAKWAVTMAKVGIRQATAKAPWPRWQFVTFCGPNKRESRGIVDLIAIRKNHGKPPAEGLKRGDELQMILIQVKGGSARKPTDDECTRLRIAKSLYRGCPVLLAAWKKGEAARFFLLRSEPTDSTATLEKNWEEIKDLDAIFE